MPELPEVEVIREYIERTSLDKPVARVSVPEKIILKNATPASLGRSLHEARLAAARRRGKYILLPTSRGDTLLFHFGMSGDAGYRAGGTTRPRFCCLELRFYNGDCLDYLSKRKLGKVSLYHAVEERDIPDVAKLGPEPLSRAMTFKKFTGILAGHRLTIHQALMNQKMIAGIGNLYSDEIAFQARVRPYRRVDELTVEELKKTYDMMKWVLRTAVRLHAELDDYPAEFLMPHRGTDNRCPICGGKLVKRTIGGRTSYYCPVCQR